MRSRTLAGFAALLRAELADLFQYRIEMFLYGLWQVVNPIIYLVIWSTVVGGGTIAGYARDDFILYYLVFMVVSHLTLAIEVYTMAPSIQTGRLSPHLLRPLHPFWRAGALNISYKAVNLMFLVPIWIGLALILRPAFNPDWLGLALFLPSMVMAALISFLIGSCFAMLAFWTTRSMSFWDIWMSLTLLLGGQVAPVAVLPGLLQQAAVVLPMRYTVGFPIEVALGRVQGAELAAGLAIQAGWTVAAAAAFVVIWRTGVKRYAAVGA
jgi:ABC-2 type transport system permease protein